VGHLLNGVTEPVLQRAFQYWRKSTRTSVTASKMASTPDNFGRRESHVLGAAVIAQLTSVSDGYATPSRSAIRSC
jgi:hypothetical protein